MKRYIVGIMTMVLLVGCGINKEEKQQPQTDVQMKQDTKNKESSEEQSKESSENKKEDRMAPDFTLKTLEGKTTKISDFKGKYVILNFWTSWCVWCDKEMPHLQKAYETFQKQGDAVIVGINGTFQEKNGVQDAKAYIEKRKYTFPVLLDETGEVASAYGVTGWPKSVFLYPDGTVAGVINGYMEEGQAEILIQQLREGKVGAKGQNQ